MSDQMMPIRADASGNVTFERIQVEEILIPDLPTGKAAPGKCAPPSDQLNFSRPMRKHLQRKISTFQKAPAPQEQAWKDRQEMRTWRPETDELG